jgi:L-alanine-DL-glutamate epimerase-like enolase superfamily enzyme
MRAPALIRDLRAEAFCIPTDSAEADGTLSWESTTIVLVHADADDCAGLGYTYASRAAVAIVTDVLQPALAGQSAFDVNGNWLRMLASVRNLGREGLCATAIAAVDSALWDLKSRLLGVSLLDLLGAARDDIEAYGSGGFTSYDEARLQRQLAGWVDSGFRAVKMKIGPDVERDLRRVAAARRAIGDSTSLLVDANGSYAAKQAMDFAERAAIAGIVWFEEPVSSDRLAALRLIRERVPVPVEIAAGEYGYSEMYFRRMLEARAVDVLQADATRCCGITGYLRADALATAFGVPLSSHCAPSLHVHVCCATPSTRNLEYFHDHVRIEQLLFEGAPLPCNGRLSPDRSRPGNGLSLRVADAEPYRV